MGIMNLKKDYEYFTSIWEEKGEKKRIHTSKAWDGRAGDWGKELEKKEDFQESMDKRVMAAADYLRSHGILGAGSEVIDIGCGPGRFVAEFARTAGHVTGVDISGKMVELGQKRAEECGVENVTFIAEDFAEMDVKALGWEKKFDLVFASITPALGTMESLEKSMDICKGYCFNSCTIKWEDELEKQIKKNVLGIEEGSGKTSFGKWFYSLLNILWIKGYLPETSYYKNDKEERIKADASLATYYARSLSRDLTVSEEMAEQIEKYLIKIADEDGYVIRKYERWQGWILWDVRVRMPRL
ncbi:MAG: methyltransferase domain-containing protein [Ruminococcus sp.]|nr:methyltransferase domain-containing protein [Ruminococcus sp.]